MLDTVRFSGEVSNFRFPFDYKRFTGYKRQDGTEKIDQILVQKTDTYRAFYIPSYERMDVEMNVGKILFNLNAYNYVTKSPQSAYRLLDFCGRCFYTSAAFHVSRVDLGGVVVYSDYQATITALERYKRARFLGAQIHKYKLQNYKYASFYPSQNWSFKVYHKGHEQKLTPDGGPDEKTPPLDEGLPNVHNMLRFEKTYRMGEFFRLGMMKIPRWGTPIGEFAMNNLYEDFYEKVRGWDFSGSPFVTERKGQIGLLALLDEKGLLSDAEAHNLVSRSTMWRYRKEKKRAAAEFKHFDSFKENLDTKSLNRLNYALTFGLQSYIFSQQKN